MAGNARFELNLGSQQPEFVENYINRPRENYPGSSLGRSRSFREGGDTRMCSSGVGAAGDSGLLVGSLPPLPQCLMLEPITMGDQKSARTGEIKRALGFAAGTGSEENYFGATNPRPSPLVAMEDLKRCKESIIDSNKKARGRSRKLDEHLQKLNKYFEVVNCKKQQGNEQSTHERSGGLKMGTQIHRNPQDLVSEREEDWAKNAVPNKRVRTSLAETRAECRTNGFARQPLVMAKDRDMLKDSNASELIEEKIRKLPTTGEGWDKKMKRKRSVGPGVMRSVDTEGELKKSMYHKGSNESGLQSCDARSFRSGSSNAASGSNKLDGNPLPAGSFARTMLKNGPEKAILMRDIAAGSNKDKFLAKGNNKLHIREGNHIVNSSPAKGKASRAPRTGSVTVAKSSPCTPRVSEAPENWEQPPSASKIQSVGGADISKRAIPSVSSSPSVAQWGGQRAPKNSRTRRSNLVSLVSNHDDRQIASAGCSPSDCSPGLNSSGMNDQHPLSGTGNGTPQFKVKLENVPSPARFSESEESAAGESRLKEKVTAGDIMEDKIVFDAQNGGPSIILAKKNKSVNKEDFATGVRKQGRGGRGSSFSTSNNSPPREKVDSATAIIKPPQSTRPLSDKHRSKAGRPVKKVFDRKGFSRRGNIPHGGSPGFAGESDDDREELLAAANLARNANYHACSSPFWKKVEPIFASISLQDRLEVSRQDEIFGSEAFGSGGIDKNLRNQIESEESAKMVDFIYKLQDIDPSFGKLESNRGLSRVTPLYQRVLSALIVEDEIEEVEENSIERNVSLQYATNDLHHDTEPRKRGRMEFEHGSTLGAQTWKQGTGNGFFSCNGSDGSIRNTFLQHPLQNDLLLEEGGFAYSEVEVLAGLSGNDLDGAQMVLTSGCSISYSNSQYEKTCIEEKLLLELQSIGLCLDAVPDLHDKEEDRTNQEIVQLKNLLNQQIGKKKVCVDKVYKSLPQGKEDEARELEHIAMDRLVELAYKKILATRGSIASKYGIPKVSKHVALAFAKRTIARCQAFEDSGMSCFSEQLLRDVLFAAPLVNEAEPSTCEDVGAGSFNGMAKRHDHPSGSLYAFENSHPSNKGGRISNRWKKKEVLLDDVGDNSTVRPPPTLGGTLLGGVKGKRSERERDKDMSIRNTLATGSQTSCRGKAKTKPKQKTAQLATSGNGCSNNISKIAHPVYPLGSSSGDLVTDGGSKKREVGLMGPGTIRKDSLKVTEETMEFRNLQLPGIDELGVGNDLGGPQDIFSLLNFEEDGLHDLDEEGLAIPMDDLSSLF